MNLNSIFESVSGTISLGDALICLLTAFGIGILTSFVYKIKNHASKSFLITLIILPAVATAIVMVTSNSIGTGIAVAGTFALIRFRTAPGTAKDIVFALFSVATGVLLGVGYIVLALILTVLVLTIYILINLLLVSKTIAVEKRLKITLPENVDYTKSFNEVFTKYLKNSSLLRSKLSNLGSLYELEYDITLLKDANEKLFLDDLRVINSNLPIVLSERPYHEEF